MKKFVNAMDDALSESLSDFAAAHAKLISLGPGYKFVRRVRLTPGKVALISGGGSGHEPLHAGFVGYGMLYAACPGQVFTSPTPDQAAAAEAIEDGAGVLFIVKNYSGDRMNFEMVGELISGAFETVTTDDDVAVESSTFSASRRGVAGTLIVEKIVGAAAEAGRNLATLKALGDRVNASTRSMGVALRSCTVPAAGRPTFQLSENDMEMGVGVHGEPGRRRVPLAPADRVGDGRRYLRRSRRPGSRRHPAARQRLRRNAAHGTLPHVPFSARTARETRRTGGTFAGRQLRHLARHGRLLDHGLHARRGTRVAVGRAGGNPGPPVGSLTRRPGSVAVLSWFRPVSQK